MNTLKKIIPYILILGATLFIAYIYLQNITDTTNKYIIDRHKVDKSVIKFIVTDSYKQEFEPKRNNIDSIKDINVYCSIEQGNNIILLGSENKNAPKIYVVNKNTDSIVYNYPIISDNNIYESNISKYRLGYDALINKCYKNITINYVHLPYIEVLDLDGKHIKTIETMDKVPFPSIIPYKNCFVYERGKAFNSNVASFVYSNVLYVFSSRVSPNSGHFVLDCYSLDTGNYIGSFNIKSYGDNNDIRNISSSNNIINIQTKKEVYQISY